MQDGDIYNVTVADLCCAAAGCGPLLVAPSRMLDQSRTYSSVEPIRLRLQAYGAGFITITFLFSKVLLSIAC
jgi:hypothetical protein